MALSQRRALLVGRLRRRKTREREGAVLVEGQRAVDEALAGGAEVRFAVHAPRLTSGEEGSSVLNRLAAAGVELHEVSDASLAELSDTEHPQGILAVCSEPSAPEPLFRAGGRYLVLDALQDPGNVGTLLRVGRAFGLDGVVALDGTVDLWSPKVVRASAGMAFRIPVARCHTEGALAALGDAGLRLLVAEGGGRDVGAVDPTPGWALVVGNEGAGPRAEVREAAAETVAVPMPGGSESLNAGVAGAILLYALTREDT